MHVGSANLCRTPPTTLEFASLTDAGLVRSHNQDCHVTDAPAGFAILAHGMGGMGGQNAGEVASELAVA